MTKPILRLHNSLTKNKESFIPINSNLVKMYVCGPTVYDHPHLGNARSVVIYDTLYRILIKLYGKKNVLYVRNITDIDDKIITRSLEEKISIYDLTKKTTEYFHSDMDYLFCLRPNIEPKATDHIEEMIEIIKKLIDHSIAYKVDGHIYFDVKKSVDYTKLSGRSFENMLQNVRIDNNPHKKNPHDFVLWKPALDSDDNSAKFDSPFGVGRPGWHIECSAMSYKYLGKDFDIHGGGIDLIFPHHTNEVAQNLGAFPNSQFARTWVHNGFLTVNSEKMSKSLNNFITVQDLIKKNIHGDTIRLFLLSNHYRKPLDYNLKAISDANKTISYWYGAIEEIENELNYHKTDMPKNFFISLLDDLNISNAIKIINDFAKQVYSTKDKEEKIMAANNMIKSAKFLGLMSCSVNDWFKTDCNSKYIDELIVKRTEAKSNKNWIEADKIRDKLLAIGISIEDKPDGSTSWKKYQR